MANKFEFVKDIKDENFLDEFRTVDGDLYKRCTNYEEDLNGRPGDCLRNVRSLNEALVKYVFYRLFDREWNKSIYHLVAESKYIEANISLIKNLDKKKKEQEEWKKDKSDAEAFREKVSSTFCYDADKIRDHANDQVHEEKRSNIDVQREAEAAVSSLAYLIRKAVTVLAENSVQIPIGVLQSKKTAIEGEVKLKFLIGNKDQKMGIYAYVKKQNFDLKDKDNNFYRWTFYDHKTGKQIHCLPKGGPFISLRDGDYENDVVCEVFNSKMSSQIKSCGGNRAFIPYNPQSGEVLEPIKEKEEIPKGSIIVKKQDEYKGDGVRLEVELENADFTLEDNDIRVEWGFTYNAGNYRSFSKGKYRSFVCNLNKNPFGGKYTCRVYRKGFSQPIEFKFRELDESDFAIQGVVKIAFDKNKLTASVSAPNFSGNPEYKWFRNGEEIEGENDRTLEVTRDDIGATYDCEVSRKEIVTGTKKADIAYTVTEKDFSIKEPILAIDAFEEESTSELPVQKPIAKLIPHVDESAPEPESDSQPNQDSKIQSESARQKPQAEKTTQKEIWTMKKPRVLRGKDCLAPELLSNTDKDNRVRYFITEIASNAEPFILNSLERVTYQEYLYRLLRAHGYERVILCKNLYGDNDGLSDVITYDILSEVSFRNPHEYMGVKKSKESREEFLNLYIKAFNNNQQATEPSDQPVGSGRRCAIGNVVANDESGSVAGDKVELSSAYGERVILQVYPDSSQSTGSAQSRTTGRGRLQVTFKMFINEYVCPALEANNITTAVVIPLCVLERYSIESDFSRNIMGSLRSNENKKNIMLLTAEKNDELASLLAGGFKGLDTAYDEARTKLEESNDRSAGSLAILTALNEDPELNKKGRILLAKKRPGIDEIANFILRQKIIENSSIFKNVPMSKVYSLAEYLFDAKEENGSFKYSSMWELEDEFNENTEEEYYSNIAKGLKFKQPICYKNLSAEALSRVINVECTNEKYSVSDEEKKERIDEAKSILNEMIGLKNVKDQLDQLAARKRFDERRGMDTNIPGSYIFAGNPGTGKTEVARQMGKIFKAMGFLEKDEVVEIKAGDIVGQHVGEAAKLTKEQCEKALGGVLFVDEAYDLVNTDGNISADGKYASTYAKEAYKTIMDYMYNYRNRICVIFAGYKSEMESFKDADPGMSRRITQTICFDDYMDDELVEIIDFMASKENMTLSQDYKDEVKRRLPGMRTREKHFGNAGEMDKILQASINIHAYLGDNDGNGRYENYQDLILTKLDLPLEQDSNDAEREKNNAEIIENFTTICADEFLTEDKHHLLNDMDTSHPSEVEMYKKARNAVLLLFTDQGFGTAFMISPNGFALTCHHVIADRDGHYSKTLIARMRIYEDEGGNSFKDFRMNFEIINDDAEYDMALIQLKPFYKQKAELGETYPYLRMSQKERSVEAGEDAILIGYPFGDKTEADPTVFKGNIASSAGQHDQIGEFRYFDGQGKRGNSGSPIISITDGQVIGILTGSDIEGDSRLTEEINKIRTSVRFWEKFTK